MEEETRSVSGFLHFDTVSKGLYHRSTRLTTVVSVSGQLHTDYIYFPLPPLLFIYRNETHVVHFLSRSSNKKNCVFVKYHMCYQYSADSVCSGQQQQKSRSTE